MDFAERNYETILISNEDTTQIQVAYTELHFWSRNLRLVVGCQVIAHTQS